MPFEVQVTQEHIDRGDTSCKACPIALAFCELFPRLKFEVHPEYLFVFAFNEVRKDFAFTLRWRLPDHVRIWILRHDSDKRSAIDRTAQPITFEAEFLSRGLPVHAE